MKVKVTHTLDFNITMNDNIYDVTAEVDVYWDYEDYGSMYPGSWEFSGYYIVWVNVSNDSDDLEVESCYMDESYGEWWREVDATVAQELEKVEPPDYMFDMEELNA